MQFRKLTDEEPAPLLPPGEEAYRIDYGNGADLAFYAMPSVTHLRDRHQLWWRSANR